MGRDYENTSIFVDLLDRLFILLPVFDCRLRRANYHEVCRIIAKTSNPHPTSGSASKALQKSKRLRAIHRKTGKRPMPTIISKNIEYQIYFTSLLSIRVFMKV